MTKYSFVGFPVQQDSSVDLPDDVVVVGANFTIQNQWQIMCLVPMPAQPEGEGAEGAEQTQTEEGNDEEGGEHADVPPES